MDNNHSDDNQMPPFGNNVDTPPQQPIPPLNPSGTVPPPPPSQPPIPPQPITPPPPGQPEHSITITEDPTKGPSKKVLLITLSLVIFLIVLGVIVYMATANPSSVQAPPEVRETTQQIPSPSPSVTAEQEGLENNETTNEQLDADIQNINGSLERGSQELNTAGESLTIQEETIN